MARKRNPGEARGDRFIFQHAAVSLWEMDISSVRTRIEQWKNAGVVDIRSHFLAHPDVLPAAIESMTLVDVNDATLRLYEAGSAAELKSPWDPRLGFRCEPALADLVADIADGRESFEMECSGRSLGGRQLDVRLTFAIPTKNDGYCCLLVSAADSDNATGEQSIVRAVIDAIPDQIFVKDLEGRFIVANRRLSAWAGVSEPLHLAGKTDFDFFPRETADKFRADDRDVMTRGEPRLNIEEEIRSLTGFRGWALTTKVPLRDRRGAISGVIGIVRDITERKTLEKSLDDERVLLRTFIDGLPDCMFLKDRDGRFLLGNKALAELMGAADTQDLAGKTDADYYPAERAARFAAEERAVFERGEKLVNQAAPWPVGGETRWFLVTKAPLRDRNGTITGLVGVSRDVTEQHVAEGALARERMYLTSLMDNFPGYVYFKDLQSRFLLTNKAHARQFKLNSPSEAVGKTDFDFFSAEHAQAAYDDEQRILQTGQAVIDLEERETWPDRPDTWVSTTKLPLLDEHGAAIGTFGVSQDISRRRLAEERNLRLAAMVEYSNDSIIGIDLEDNVTSWNTGAEKVFGYPAAEMIGRPLTLLITAEVVERLPTIKESLLHQGRAQQFESTVTRKDGKKISVSSTLSLIQDGQLRIVGTTLISRDITEQKTLQAQVIRAQRLESLGTLAAGIAHQFNNINAAVKGYLDVVMGEGGVPSNVLLYTREALKGVERSVEITERLQSFSSAAHARQENIALGEIVPSLLALFDGPAQEAAVEIRPILEERAVVRGSRSMIGFVITSMLNNALHALLERPVRVITVRTVTAEGYCALEVSDTGCGISAENLPRIFTPFFTTKGEWAEPASPQARVKGIGLSLSVCQSTVAEQGGWIEVESVPGAGATFRAWLPAPMGDA